MQSIILIALLLTSALTSLLAQSGAPKTYSSPQEARDALLQALESTDSKLEEVLGAGSLALLTTGDKERDEKQRVGFTQAMKAKNGVVPVGLSSESLAATNST